MGSQIIPTQTEVRLAYDELIISKTDLSGRITYANKVFMRISDFSEEDLLGQPHNMIRHPDMPRGVFWGLWNTLKQGREFFGLVKNMTAHGDYYWVLANVRPDFLSGMRIPAIPDTDTVLIRTVFSFCFLCSYFYFNCPVCSSFLIDSPLNSIR